MAKSPEEWNNWKQCMHCVLFDSSVLWRSVRPDLVTDELAAAGPSTCPLLQSPDSHWFALQHRCSDERANNTHKYVGNHKWVTYRTVQETKPPWPVAHSVKRWQVFLRAMCNNSFKVWWDLIMTSTNLLLGQSEILNSVRLSSGNVMVCGTSHFQWTIARFLHTLYTVLAAETDLQQHFQHCWNIILDWVLDC